MNAFHQALSKAGMRINNKKTVVMHCGKTHSKVNLTIGNHRLEQVKEFKYVGTIIDERGQIDTELASQISHASRIFGSLCRRVFRNPDIEIRDQMRIYDAKVLSVLLYNAEVWTLKEKQMQKLEVFHMKNIRYICGKTRLDKMRNTQDREYLSKDSSKTDELGLHLGTQNLRAPSSRSCVLSSCRETCSWRPTNPMG